MFIETHSVHINCHTLRKAHHSVAGTEYPRTLSAIPFAYQRTLSSSNTRSKRPNGGQLTPCTQQNAFGLLVNILGNPSVDFRRLSDRLKQHKLKTKDSDERPKRKTQTKDSNHQTTSSTQRTPREQPDRRTAQYQRPDYGLAWLSKTQGKLLRPMRPLQKWTTSESDQH